MSPRLTHAGARNVVLLSGGLDSATVAAQLLRRSSCIELVFVDYGQPAAAAERGSAGAISEWFELPLVQLVCGPLASVAGEIPGRNALLVHAAMAMRPGADAIHIGIHAETGYRDCSPAFVEVMQTSLDFHTDGCLRLSAPLIRMNKAEVAALAADLGVPIDATYSCESANEPCGECSSCRDRRALADDAR